MAFEVRRSVVYQNIALHDGGGMYMSGLGTRMSMSNCSFQSNEAQYGNGGGLFPSSLLKISDTFVLSNTDTSGGGCALVGSIGSVIGGLLLENNSALDRGDITNSFIHLIRRCRHIPL